MAKQFARREVLADVAVRAPTVTSRTLEVSLCTLKVSLAEKLEKLQQASRRARHWLSTLPGVCSQQNSQEKDHFSLNSHPNLSLLAPLFLKGERGPQERDFDGD